MTPSNSTDISQERQGLMALIDNFLGLVNLIDRVEGWLMALRYGDYASARRRGVLGVAGEVGSSVLGTNTFTFALVRTGAYSLNEVEALLWRYGIAIFGRTHDARCMYFRVKKRQARWAEYLMLQQGVELANPTFDPRNTGYAGGHAPGWMPRPWSAGADPQAPANETTKSAKAGSWLDELRSSLDGLL